MPLKVVYQRYLRFARNPDLSPGQRADYARQAQRLKAYLTPAEVAEADEPQDAACALDGDEAAALVA